MGQATGTDAVKASHRARSGAEPQFSELDFFSCGTKKMGLCGGAIRISLDC